MSFRKFSESQATPRTSKPTDEPKPTPASVEPAAQPDTKHDEAAPAQKS